MAAPEEEGKAELKEDTEHKRDEGEDGAYAFDEGVAESEGRTSKVGLEGRAEVFHQDDVNVSLRDGGDKMFMLALGCGHDVAGLGDVFFKSDRIA